MLFLKITLKIGEYLDFPYKKKNVVLLTQCNAIHCCYITALVLTSHRLTNGRAKFFRPETIVASFLHLLQSDIQLYFKTPVCGAPFS